MSVLKAFEVDALRRLGGRTLSAPQVVQLSEEGELASLEFSGVGYFLTLRHRSLPVGRLVLDDPILSGKVGDLLIGFVAFIESGEVTLECFSYSGEALPKDFRDSDVTLIK